MEEKSISVLNHDDQNRIQRYNSRGNATSSLQVRVSVDELPSKNLVGYCANKVLD